MAVKLNQASVLLASLTIFICFSLSDGVQPQLKLSPEHGPFKHKIHEDEPIDRHSLTINEGYSIDVPIQTSSSITLNLNRPVAEDIYVTVQVYSGTELIELIANGNRTNVGNPATYRIKYESNTFGDQIVNFHSRGTAGHAEIVFKIEKQPKNVEIDDSSSYISVNIANNLQLTILISIVGWIYFAAWSLSFYFQLILNFRRKSVVGLNFDFMALNLLGFTFYSIYNFALMFSREVQKDYYERHTYSRIPVEYNDLFFAVHAFVITLVTVIQCFIYEREQQKVSVPASLFVGCATVMGFLLYIVYLTGHMGALDVVLYLSYVKLGITIVKYTPQAYMNYKRKTTSGWSIHNILLDFTGGVFSTLQMFLLAYNYNDWNSIFGNFTKFGLGVVSISFDILFVIQHYILYKQDGHLDISTDSVPDPVISETIRSSSFRQSTDPPTSNGGNNEESKVNDEERNPDTERV